MNRVKAASRRCLLLYDAAPGYGPVPPASRVAIAIAQRRACGPPVTPEPLRPLNQQRHRAGAGRCPPGARRRTQTKIKSLQPSLYGFTGLPGGRRN